jgi:GntR family transcriptional regulator
VHSGVVRDHLHELSNSGAPRLTDPQPVFNLFRTAFDESGAPVEVCEHVMSGDRWLLTYEWAAD